MLDCLKNDILNEDVKIRASILMEAVANAPEDEFLENIAIPEEEDKKIKGLLDKIPDTDFQNDATVSDKDLADADSDIEDPTTDQLLADLDDN